MKQPGHETQPLEKLLDKYRFTRPVPPEIRAGIMSSKKETYVRILKTVGAFTAIHGAFASLYFAAKKAGIGIAIAKVIAAGTAVLSISIGGYYAAHAVIDRLYPGTAKPAPGSVRSDSGWVDEIMLFDGRIIRGAIISRGDSYRVRTARGIMLIPRKQIKAVRPLAGERTAPR